MTASANSQRGRHLVHELGDRADDRRGPARWPWPHADERGDRSQVRAPVATVACAANPVEGASARGGCRLNGPRCRPRRPPVRGWGWRSGCCRCRAGGEVGCSYGWLGSRAGLVGELLWRRGSGGLRRRRRAVARGSLSRRGRLRKARGRGLRVGRVALPTGARLLRGLGARAGLPVAVPVPVSVAVVAGSAPDRARASARAWCSWAAPPEPPDPAGPTCLRHPCPRRCRCHFRCRCCPEARDCRHPARRCFRRPSLPRRSRSAPRCPPGARKRSCRKRQAPPTRGLRMPALRTEAGGRGPRVLLRQGQASA